MEGGELGEYRRDGGDVGIGEAADAARGAKVAGGYLGDAVEPSGGGSVKPCCLPFAYGVVMFESKLLPVPVTMATH